MNLLKTLKPPADHEIHVWHGLLGDFPAHVETFRTLLADDELERARRYRMPEHSHGFIIGRGLLRMLLGSYLGTSPEEVALVYGKRGKPGLPAAAGGTVPLEFNLAHSNTSLAFIFCTSGKVGIDVENTGRAIQALPLARRILSADELKAFNDLPPLQQNTELLRTWTLKEACLKAMGTGISGGMAQVHIHQHHKGRLGCTQGYGSTEPERCFHLRELGSDPHVFCAMATERACPVLREYPLSGIVDGIS